MQQTGDVHFIADNTGTELAMDLALADGLFDKGIERVIFHLKLHPTFVSDTTVPDMQIMLAAMRSKSVLRTKSVLCRCSFLNEFRPLQSNLSR